MRTKTGLFYSVLLMFIVASPLRAETKSPASGPVSEVAQPAISAQDYRVGPGDLLYIEVWKDRDLARPVTVLPDGKIVFPLVGEVGAAGKTVSELQKEIAKSLSRFVKDAVVTVEIRQVNSMQIYVLGRVKTPGRIILTSNIDVLQALASAGGPDEFAKRSRMRIFRRVGGKIDIIPFDYEEVIAGKNLESNILLRRGDVVVVP